MSSASEASLSVNARFSFRNDFPKVFVIALAYFLAHGISFFFPDSEKVIMLVWPAGGVGLAAFLLNPRRIWPLLTLAFYISGITADVFLAGRSFMTGLGYMTGNMVESIGCALLILRITVEFQKFTKVREVLALIAGTIFINAFSSCIGALTSVLTRNAYFADAWRSWYISDGLGILLIGPLIVVWSGNIKSFLAELPWEKILEFTVFLLIWSTLCIIIFFNLRTGVWGFHPYVLIPLLAWPAARLEQRGVVLALIFLFAIAIISPSIVHGPSPWDALDTGITNRLLELQLFLGFLAIVGYLMSAGYSNVRRAEAALKESEERFRNLYQNALIGLYRTTPDGKILLGNRALVKMLGHSSFEELKERNLEQSGFEPSYKRKHFIELIEKNGEVKDLDAEWIRKDGTSIIVKEQAKVIRDTKGNALYYDGMVEDITERKLAEKALLDSENRLRQVINLVPHFIFAKDINGKFILANEAVANVYGTTVDNLLGKTDADFGPNLDEVKNFQEDDKKVIVSGIGKYRIEETITDSNGVKRVLETSKIPFTTSGTNILAVLGISVDITERKQTEKELSHERNLLRTLIDSLPETVLIYIKDTESRYVINNLSHLRSIGAARQDEVIGKTSFDFFQHKHAERFFADEQEVIRTGNALIDKEEFHDNRDGKSKWHLTTKVPFQNAEGKIVGLVGMSSDITERKRIEQELSIYRTKLEDLVKARTSELNMVNEALQREIDKQKEYEIMLQLSLDKEKELSEMKSRFISTTSHEFRTPLTSILSSAELIQRYSKQWNDDKKNIHLNRIQKSVDYLTKLLDDILTISRSETGNINYNPGPIDLQKCAEECSQDVKPLMTEMHELRINYNTEQKIFSLDLKLMKYIFNNLLSNAVKYSPEGGKVDLTISSDDRNIFIEIADEGIGIPDNERDKIFTSFYRTRNVEDISGTGLGLSIVKYAVDLQSGEIKFKSEINKGTTFIVKIPIRIN